MPQAPKQLLDGPPADRVEPQVDRRRPRLKAEEIGLLAVARNDLDLSASTDLDSRGLERRLEESHLHVLGDKQPGWAGREREVLPDQPRYGRRARLAPVAHAGQ